MTRRFSLYILPLLIVFALSSQLSGFDHNDENYDRENKEFIGYTKENIDSGRLKGGHDTITSEAVELKKEVHKGDWDYFYKQFK